MPVITDNDFNTRVLTRLITPNQVTMMANQLGIPVAELGHETRINLAHLAIHALEASVSVDINNSNNQSNQVLATILSKMPVPAP